VFNPMEPHELMLAVGRVLRAAARPDAAGHEFQRSQMLSAHSVCRHLAAEQAGAADLLAWVQGELDPELAGHPEARARVAAARGGAEIGGALQDVLDGLARDDPLRARLHRILAELADREVAILAAAA
jgi:hypothetical protein